MPRTRLSLLLTLAALLLAAGCGGDARVEYEQDLRSVGAGIERSLGKLPSGDGAQVDEEELARLAADVARAAEQLDELEPPERVRGAHRQLQQGLAVVADALDELARDVGDAPTPEEHSAVFVEFATDERIDAAFADIETAQETFADAGYSVFRRPPARPAS